MEDQSPQKEVAVFYEKWLLIRGVNYDALTGINLYFVVVVVLFVGWFFLVLCFEQMFLAVFPRVCPIFQISNVTGENLDLLKMFLNLLSIRAHFKRDEPSEFQIDDTYSVPVRHLPCHNAAGRASTGSGFTFR